MTSCTELKADEVILKALRGVHKVRDTVTDDRTYLCQSELAAQHMRLEFALSAIVECEKKLAEILVHTS